MALSSKDSSQSRQHTNEAPTAVTEHTQTQQEPGSNPAHVGLSLQHNFLWTLFGNMVYSACQWGMLVALAKLGTPELVGRFALALAITAPIVLLFNLQLRAVQATDAKFDYLFGDYLALKLITATAAIAVIIAAAIISCDGLALILTVIAVGAAKTFESVSDIYYGLMQLHERLDRMSISSMIKGPLSLAAITGGVYLTHGLVWGTTCMAAGVATVLLVYDIPMATKLMMAVKHLYIGREVPHKSLMRPVWDKEKLIRLTRLSLPLGFTMMLISLNTNIPRYFIARHSGERELGIFAAMAYLLVAGTIAVGALADSASPKLAKHYAAGDRKAYTTLLGKLVGLGALAGAIAVGVVTWAGQWVLITLYGKDYAQYPMVFTWIAVAAAIAFIQWFLGTGMTAARCFRIQVLLLGSNTLITVAASAILIPRYGLTGAAIALVVANAALALGTLAIVVSAVRRIGDAGSSQFRHAPVPENHSEEKPHGL